MMSWRIGLAGLLFAVLVFHGFVAVRAAAPLSQLSVRLSDLRAGYQPMYGHYLSASQVAFGIASDVTAATLYQHGWLRTYAAAFTHKAKPRGDVIEEITQFGNWEEARWAYCLNLGPSCTRFGMIPAHVGDEAIILNVRIRYNATSVGPAVTIYFRQGRYFVNLIVAPASRTQSLMDLAHLVSLRMKAHG
jgi:hypothetical protein